MRIAIFSECYFPFITGVVTHVKTLKEALESQGHEVLIVTTNPKALCHYVKNDVLYCPAIPLKRIYGYGVSNPMNIQRLRILKEFNPDILHIHTEFSMGIFGQFVAKKLKKPFIYTLHTMYDDYLFYVAPHKWGQKMVKPAAHMYIRSIASKATEVIGPSLKVLKFLRQCGVERHINIVPNTVDLSDFLEQNVDAAEVEKIRAELGIRANDVAMCFVGRLGREKALDVLIDMLHQHFHGDLRYKLFIIGDGPERKNLADQIERLDMMPQIRLLGKIEHSKLPPYYHACDLYTTASLSEINSISMLEAMASGLYVLQRLDVYNRSQISSGENGEVFEEPAEFAALVREHADLSPEQQRNRRTLVTEVAQRYGQKEFLQAILQVYHRAISEYRA